MRSSLVLAALVVASSANAAGLVQVQSFGSNPGALAMYEYIPSGLPSGSPLVVVLHGCTQSASSMVEAGWNTLADQYHFAVLYPQQQSANNPVECFNWAGEYGDTANLTRGMGENQSVISMIDTEISTHQIATNKVYVVGFSAGAAMTAVLAATWPDRFEAAAVMSGVAYKCATSVSEAYSCQSPGVTKTPSVWGDLVRGASSMTHWPRMQLWQGSSDSTVAPANQVELVKQWTNVWGGTQTADETETLANSAGTRNAYKVNGQIVVETYTISGMSHAVVVGTDGSTTCPGTAGSYFEDHKICSTIRAATFFGLTGTNNGNGSGSGSGSGSNNGNGSTTPFVSIISPTNGEDVSGTVAVVVAANDDAGVTNVELSIDGVSVGTDATAPYQFTWDASAAMAGSHTLVATATDAAHASASVTSTVMIAAGSGANAETPHGLPSCSLNAGGAYGGLAPIGVAFIAILRRRRQRR